MKAGDRVEARCEHFSLIKTAFRKAQVRDLRTPRQCTSKDDSKAAFLLLHRYDGRNKWYLGNILSANKADGSVDIAYDKGMWNGWVRVPAECQGTVSKCSKPVGPSL